MEKYRRVEKPRVEQEIKEKNEIRVTTQGKMRNYITYATSLLQDKQSSSVVLKAMGRAINKTVTIAEIIKRRIPGLHQLTAIDSTDITDVWEPLEEGLDNVETTRHVSSIQITLSTQPLDTKAPGYQPPLPADQIKGQLSEDDGPREGRGRGFGRGGRGRGGRPRIRGGRGRGGFGESHVEHKEEGGAAPAEGPVHRGRGGRGFRRPRGGRGGGRGGFGESHAVEDAQEGSESAPRGRGFRGRPFRGRYRGGRSSRGRGFGRGGRGGEGYSGGGRGGHEGYTRGEGHHEEGHHGESHHGEGHHQGHQGEGHHQGHQGEGHHHEGHHEGHHGGDAEHQSYRGGRGRGRGGRGFGRGGGRGSTPPRFRGAPRGASDAQPQATSSPSSAPSDQK